MSGECIEKLMKKNPQNLCYKNHYTLFHVASRKGYLFTMKFLFESLKGRDVLMYCHSKGFMKNNLMHEAVANGHLKIVKYLEGNGFDF